MLPLITFGKFVLPSIIGVGAVATAITNPKLFGFDSKTFNNSQKSFKHKQTPPKQAKFKNLIEKGDEQNTEDVFIDEISLKNKNLNIDKYSVNEFSHVESLTGTNELELKKINIDTKKIDAEIYSTIASFSIKKDLLQKQKNSSPKSLLFFSINTNISRKIKASLSLDEVVDFSLKIFNIAQIKIKSNNYSSNIYIQTWLNEKTNEIIFDFLETTFNDSNSKNFSSTFYKKENVEIEAFLLKKNSDYEPSKLKTAEKNINSNVKYFSVPDPDLPLIAKPFGNTKIMAYTKRTGTGNKDIELTIKKNKLESSVIKNPLLGKDGIPSNTEEKLRLGLHLNIPLRLTKTTGSKKEHVDISLTSTTHLYSLLFKNNHNNHQHSLYINNYFYGINHNKKILVNSVVKLDESGDLKITISVKWQTNSSGKEEKDNSIVFNLFQGESNALITPIHWIQNDANNKNSYAINLLLDEKKTERPFRYKVFIPEDKKQKQFGYSMSVLEQDGKKSPSSSSNLDVSGTTYSGWTATYNFLTHFGIEKEKKETKSTNFVVSASVKDTHLVSIPVVGLDSEGASLLFNSRHKHSTKQTLFTKKDGTSTDGDKKIDATKLPKHCYDTEEKDKTYDELRKYDTQQRVNIEIKKLSSDPQKPTLIPFRMVTHLSNVDGKKKSWSDVKDIVPKIAGFLLKKVENSDSLLFKANTEAQSDVEDWKKVNAASDISNLNSPHAVVFYDIIGYTSTTGNNLTIHIELRCWGWSYIYQPGTNVDHDPWIGAEGGAGFKLGEDILVFKNETDTSKIPLQIGNSEWETIQTV